MKSPPPNKNNRISCTKFAIRTNFAWEKQASVQPTVNMNAACSYNCKVFTPKQCVRWTYICACTRNWVAFICSPLSHYCLIFHLCICKFLSSPWIYTMGTGRMDLIITYSGLPPNLTRCTSSQILLLATFHCQVLHKCILPCILPILESRGKEIHKAFGKSNALFIAQPCSWKFWFLRP